MNDQTKLNATPTLSIVWWSIICGFLLAAVGYMFGLYEFISAAPWLAMIVIGGSLLIFVAIAALIHLVKRQGIG